MNPIEQMCMSGRKVKRKIRLTSPDECISVYELIPDINLRLPPGCSIFCKDSTGIVSLAVVVKVNNCGLIVKHIASLPPKSRLPKCLPIKFMPEQEDHATP